MLLYYQFTISKNELKTCSGHKYVLANKIYMKIDNVIFWSNLKDY
jgi:hypothetical protein